MAKIKTIESTTFDNVLGFLWAILVLGTTTYLVFWQHHSGWWYLLAAVFCSVSVNHKKVEEET